MINDEEKESWRRVAERLEREKAAILAAIAAYDDETARLPLGHEMPTRGSSTYNWRSSVVSELRAAIAVAMSETK